MQPNQYYGQPGYGQPPPMYGQPPAYGQPGYVQPPMYGQPQTIIIQQNEATITNMAQTGDIEKCAQCQTETDNITRYQVGGVTFAWCCCLLFTTGILCWIPFVCDGCKDT